MIKFVDEKPKRDQRDLNRAINCLCCILTTQKIRGFPPPGTITNNFYFFILGVKIIDGDRIISLFWRKEQVPIKWSSGLSTDINSILFCPNTALVYTTRFVWPVFLPAAAPSLSGWPSNWLSAPAAPDGSHKAAPAAQNRQERLTR